MSLIDSDKIRREQLRWILILAMQNARPYGTNEIVLLATVQGVYADATALEVRRELDYLESRRLVELRKQPSGLWWADLTRHGVDLAEYNIECEPGVARPPKYW